MISVIVPVHNGSHYIERCIDSIAKSSYEHIEIIVVENGSTDSTYEICKKLSEYDDRIRLFSTEQCGVSNARNIGIDNAYGDWISFVDADDYISPVMLQKLMETTLEYSADLVFCDIIHGDEEFFDFSEMGRSIDGSKNVKIMTLDSFFCETYLRAQYKYSVVFNKLFNRRTLGEIRFNRNLYYIEDRNFVIQYALNCKKNIISIPDKLYYYYRNKDSISNSADQQRRMGQVYATLSDIDVLKRRGANPLYCDFVYANLLQLADFRMRQAKKYQCQGIQNELLPIISDAKASVFRGKLKVKDKIRFLGEHYYYMIREILNK